MIRTNPIEEVEKRGEMIQLGMAAASAAGLLTILSVGASDRPLWWAGLLFAVAIPMAIGRALMTFTALLTGVYISPVSWLMYPLGMGSCTATATGYVLITFHLSPAHGYTFCSFTILAVLLMYVHFRKTVAVFRSRPNQASEPTASGVTPPAGAGDRAAGSRGSP
ncbi:hypothetical protein [Opitutus terrae]|uniref:Uncharacterized protein n=1 Tax=Opitutus terrae (strain DSM 11246 / JCM 15787 / PB90-1) TaxID=452637 RepID=B1ZZ05_OPITP|nr:hypothetical protein [Opitutus terrae]ACB76328.1 hypothetical protein Oter_3048 [Opitutus terrae PB90-1]